MKQLKRIGLVLLFLTLTCMAATAQTSENFTLTNASQTASSPAPLTREQVIAKLVAEVKAGRVTIAELKERIASLEAQVTAEKANSASLATSYSKAQTEIGALRTAVAALERATQLYEQTIALLKEDNGRLKKEAKKARMQTVIVVALAVGKEVLRLIF